MDKEIGKEILSEMYDCGLIKTWYRDRKEGWILHSGLWSPFYINLRRIGSYPSLFKKATWALTELIREKLPEVNTLIGIATAGVPIAAAAAVQGGYAMGYTRKLEGVRNTEELREKISQYGQHSLVEGEFDHGTVPVMVDDLVTRFSSKMIAIEQFNTEMKNRGLKLKCKAVAVILDREQGAAELAAENGIELISLIRFKTEGIELLKERLHPIEYKVIKSYMEDPGAFADPEERKRRIEIS